MRQIDKYAQDSSYQGKNLLNGSGIRFDATSSSRSAVNAITGIDNTKVTNVVKDNDYVITILGNGAITGKASDLANTERDRGISSLSVSGFASKTSGSFDSLTLKLAGGKGRDKTFTVTEGDVSYSRTFTVAEWRQAKAANQVLVFDHQFSSGTHVTFDVNFDDIEDVPDTAGAGISTIEKFVDLQVSATSANGIGEESIRNAAYQLGQSKLANGENAFAF